jgi:hypothetical protein
MTDTQLHNKLIRVAKSSVQSDGHIAPFKNQLERYAFGDIPSGELLVVSEHSTDLNVPISEDLPLVLRQSTIEKVKIDHAIPLLELCCLPEWIRNHPLAFDSYSDSDSIIILADVLDIHSNNIIVIIRHDQQKRELVVNELTSVYGKRNLCNFLESTFDAHKNFYVNNRTGGWITGNRLQLPERVTRHLFSQCNTIEEAVQVNDLH